MTRLLAMAAVSVTALLALPPARADGAPVGARHAAGNRRPPATETTVRPGEDGRGAADGSDARRGSGGGQGAPPSASGEDSGSLSGAGGSGREGRRGRRGIEQPPPPSQAELARREQTLHLERAPGQGCSLGRKPALFERLLGLTNESQVLFLELWGDRRRYRDGDTVLFYLRTPYRMHVTLFWLGPDGDAFVPFDALAIPADRDVSVDPDAVIVPPLGQERWVGLATLEPLPLPCGADEQALGAWLDRVLALPHAVGRWEVTSDLHRAPPPLPALPVLPAPPRPPAP